MSLVVFTGFAGLYAAPGHLHPLLAAVAVLAIAVGAGAAGAINMWYERDIDALMARTRARPMPSAAAWSPRRRWPSGSCSALLSVMHDGHWRSIGWRRALLALANAFYVFVYTIWLKRRTPQNIVIGGAAGAFPPMIGWAAVTGHRQPRVGRPLPDHLHVDAAPLLGPGALPGRSDYAKAGVPMLPVVAGKAETRRQIFIYALLLLAARPGCPACWGPPA